jgi:hypothetical protein
MYIVAFNGPPRSGKDTLSHFFADKVDSDSNIACIEVSLSTPLRFIAYAMTNWTGATNGPNYEKFKTTHFEEFGKDGRQIMIDVSERFLKPAYGQDIMSRMLLTNHFAFDGVMLIRDSGFQNEIEFLSHCVGPENLFVVNVQRTGCDFSNDSREWVSHIFSTTVENNGSFDDLRASASNLFASVKANLGWKL